MDNKSSRSQTFPATAYEPMPSLQTLASATQHNPVVEFASPRHEETLYLNELDDNNNPVSTHFLQSSNTSASPAPTSRYYRNTSPQMSGGTKVGLIVGFSVGLILVLILLVYLIMRRKYGPDMWTYLHARLLTRTQSAKEQSSPKPGSATRRHEEHRSWYMGETSSKHNDGRSKTVLEELWESLKRLFTSPDTTDVYDTSVKTNAIPLDNQQRRNGRMIDPRYSLGTTNSPYNTPHDTPRGSPAIVSRTRESSSRVSIPSYYMQYSNQFISPPQTPGPSSYKTDTRSTRDSDDQSRIRNLGSWAHYQKHRRRQQQQQRKSTRVPSVETINEQSAAKFSSSPSGSSGNRRSTRGETHKHRRSSLSSTSTLPVFRQHPGEEVDFSSAAPKKRIRSSILNRLMSS